MAAFSARLSRVDVDGVKILANRWTANVKTDELDVTTFESDRYGDFIPGIVEADVSVEGFFDSANNPHEDPPNIRAGAVITLTLYTDDVASDHFDFPFFLVTSCSVEAEVRGALRISFTGRNKGIFRMPGAVEGDPNA